MRAGAVVRVDVPWFAAPISPDDNREFQVGAKVFETRLQWLVEGVVWEGFNFEIVLSL